MIADDEKFELLQKLAKLSHSGYDSANIFNQMRDIAEQLTDCDNILIFTNDQDNNILTAANHYNNLSASFNNLTVPYSDSLVIDILVNKKHKSRLYPENPVLPGTKTELFVPIIAPQIILGCLYLARKKETAFSPDEIKLTEMTADYFAMVMERTEWEKQRFDFQGAKQKNKSLTISFLESLQQPAIIIDTFKDKFFQANQFFLDLLDIDKSKLPDTPFSVLCKDHLKIKDLTPDNKQNFITNWSFKDSQIKSMKTVFTFLDNVDKGLILLLFQEEKEKDQALKNFWLHELFASLSAVTFSDLQTDYENAANIIFSLFKADFITIHRTLPDQSIQCLAIYENSKESTKTVTENIKKLHSPNYLVSVADKQKPVYIEDITQSTKADNLSTLGKSGILSIASIPLIINNTSLGVLTLYFKQPFIWNTKDRIKLASICQISSYFIFSPQLKNELEYAIENQALLNNISKLTFTESPLEIKVSKIAQELLQHLEFDYFSLTLFDESGNIDNTIDLTLPELVKSFDIPLQKEKLPDNRLIRVHQSLKESAKKTNAMQPFRLPFSLPAHTSVVMVHGEKYLGNFALGRLQKKAFSRTENELLKKISTFLSGAVTLQNNQNKSTLWEKSCEIQEKLHINMQTYVNKQDFLNSICTILKSLLNGMQCKGVFIHENMKMLDLFEWVPSQSLKLLSLPKIKKLLTELTKSRKPLMVSNIRDFTSIFCIPESGNEKMDFFNPFVISPVIKDNKIYALLLLTWKSTTLHGQNELLLMEIITRQIERLLLYYEKSQILEEKNKDLENYSHMVAHELKSPLQTIKNYASILNEDLGVNISSDSRQYMDRLLINLDNMENMITELLNISRFDNTETEFAEFDPKPVIEKSLLFMDKLIKQTRANIKIDKTIPKIYGNATGFEHIISNLISNAIKYTQESDIPVITIYGRKNTKSTEITVADQGIGIDKKDQEKIFELFYKQNDTPKQMSTGLGLPLVKRIVDQHKGSIKVESQPNKGSRFIVTFPNKI